MVSKEEQVPALPTTPQNILRYYFEQLTDYEKAEILDYDTIYFIGVPKSKKVDGKQQQTEKQDTGEQSSNDEEDKEKKNKFTHNYGYDDDKGDYNIIMGDHIGYRYEVIEFLGKGSFGTALKCIDHKEKKEVAVKIVKNKKKYYYQASVELRIL